MPKEIPLKSFVIASLRRASYRWPARYKVMNAARIQRGIYLCNSCKKPHARKHIKMDHIDPVVDPTQGFTTWDSYIARLFVDESGWQVLCKTCHDTKTKEERVIRKRHKPISS